jgi:predicted YcjX-like family ATPase
VRGNPIKESFSSQFFPANEKEKGKVPKSFTTDTGLLPQKYVFYENRVVKQ